MSKIAPTMMRRFQDHKPSGNPWVYSPDSAAVTEARTRYPHTVRSPQGEFVLKSGHHNRKIGAVVVKGKWAGMAIYTLTLEERATCPRTCAEWLACYGNKLNRAYRYKHGAGLIRALADQLSMLEASHPQGFVVRLHVLGDFYSAEYVNQWLAWLDEYPGLHVFGYTAHAPGSEIGKVLDAASKCRWDRFAIRFSGSDRLERSAVVVAHEALAPEDAIVCPAQTTAGADKCCGSCSLCWATTRPIAFVRH